MAISNELLSTTLYDIRDKEVDNLYKRTAFLDSCRKLNGVETISGGIKIQRALSFFEHSSLTQLVNGYEPINLSVADTMVPAIYDWTDLVQPVVISEKEESENSGELAIIKILEARMRNVMSHFKRDVNKQILQGGVTAASNLNTLNGVLTGGFLENSAVGTQTGVVGGLSKATAPTRGWSNQFGDAVDAFGTNGLAQMYQIHSGMTNVTAMGQFALAIASGAGFQNYKRVIQANERYVDLKTLDAGRMALAFADGVVEQDLDMPASAGADEEYTMYFLNFDGIKLVIHGDYDFAVKPFETIPTHALRTARVCWKGQLVADHLGSQGVLVDGNTF